MQFMRLLLFILLFNTNVLAQSTNHNTTKKTNTKDSIPEFNTAGEQEEYNVLQMFKKEYKKQHYKRYSGTVKTINNLTFQFDTLTMIVNYTPTELRSIFGQGILCPSLFGSEDSLRITDLQELKYVNNGPTYKRFSLWLFRKWLANPQVYYFELTNEKATITTNLKDFIKGSQLTYFRPGGIII
jgi:hypothetical protein